jgi:hypothetical protein
MLTATQAAVRAGIAVKTWTSYVARGQAPLPDERDLKTGNALWQPETVDRWLATRPGQGARTDLPRTAGSAGNGETTKETS